MSWLCYIDELVISCFAGLLAPLTLFVHCVCLFVGAATLYYSNALSRKKVFHTTILFLPSISTAVAAAAAAVARYFELSVCV